MKRTILFLFLVEMAYGQDSLSFRDSIPQAGTLSIHRYTGLLDTGRVFFEPSWHFGRSSAGHKVIVNGDTVRTKESPYLIAPVVFLVQQYDEYAKECYGDSAMQINGRNLLYAHPTNPPRFVYAEYDTLYVHREPTLGGFIEYLRRKQ